MGPLHDGCVFPLVFSSVVCCLFVSSCGCLLIEHEIPLVHYDCFFHQVAVPFVEQFFLLLWELRSSFLCGVPSSQCVLCVRARTILLVAVGVSKLLWVAVSPCSYVLCGRGRCLGWSVQPARPITWY